MSDLDLMTEDDNTKAALLMGVTFTLTGEFYDWLHFAATNEDRTKLMEKFPRPGDLFLRVIGPWTLELVTEFGTKINDRIVANRFSDQAHARIFGEPTTQTGGIGAEIGAPGVKQEPGKPVEDVAG